MKKPPTRKPAAKPAASPKAGTAKTTDFTELRSLQEIKDLIDFVAERQFDEIELVRGDFHLRVSRGVVRTESLEHQTTVAPMHHVVSTVHAEHDEPAAPGTHTAAAPPAVEAAANDGLYVIHSPIVGTFYRSSSPEAEAFVKVGDSISSGQTLCIVEAMKLMNEIQSDVGGSIVKIFVDNAQPVEYGQPLFGIKI